jgi:hypothetical protein
MTDPGNAAEQGNDGREELTLEVEEIGDLEVPADEADQARGGTTRNIMGKPGDSGNKYC